MTIRRLVPSDAVPYRALMLAAYERHPEAFTSSVAERAALPMAWWESRLDAAPQPAEVVLGAFAGDDLAAVAGLAFEKREKARHKASLFGMYVAPAHRNAGIGQRLVEAALAYARARPGVLQVELTVTDGNAAARALYERCGFVQFGLEPLAVAVGGGFVAKVHMWCDLRGASAGAVAPGLPTCVPDLAARPLPLTHAGSMAGVDIRRGDAADAPRFAVLATQVWLDTYARDGIRRPIADYVLREFTVERTAALLRDPESLVLVAERDAHLIGFAVVVPGRAPPGHAGANAAEIDRIYVQESGCRRGIGSRLMAAIAPLAAARGAAQLWLKVWVHNTRARQFYDRQGFADIGAAYFVLDGEQHENRVLAKPIAAAVDDRR